MPGIHLHSSNRLERLADSFAEILRSDPLPPLQNETVLVQSRGMARWLAMETANRLSIWSNVDCPFPNTFINDIYKLLLPGLPDVSPYDKEYILWHLMDILPEATKDSHFGNVASYLDSGDDLKLYQLSYETADLFDQYTLFRPRMILGWEENIKKIPADHLWQSTVWCRLVDRLRQNGQFPEYHRARLLQLFDETVSSPVFDRAVLPPRVSIFGISSLPPYHLKVLSLLAQHIDLHFFIMNPCREYWFDIIADRDIVKIMHREAADQDTLHLRQGNSLLASMGHLGRDFMAMLQDLHAEDHEYFMDPEDVSLLSYIQQDILHLQENNVLSSEETRTKRKIHVSDGSLVFHSCHSPMREVEVLYDQLLAVFDKKNDEKPIEPKDILVMAPEIDVYAPLIRAVFDAETSSHKKIPYSISDQSIRETSKYIETFLDILLLPGSRFSSIDILGFLGAEAVKNRFALNDRDLSLIENWIRETRICWGIDEEHKAGLNLPPYRENTWKAGLDRMLLGYAMSGDGQSLFESILPYAYIEGTETNLLGNFLEFSETIFNLAGVLQKSHSLAEWSKILLHVKDKLMLPDAVSEADDRVLHRLIHRLRELENKTLFKKEVSLAVIRSFLINSLDERFSPIAGGTGFLSGGVTFCSMLPMRAIPFKVICLLGMNDGLYPRSGRNKSFDLMALEPKRGDRSKRYDDRYLFLESILSARQKLSISFVGQSIRDGVRRPPSVLVSELMDYIDQGYEKENAPDEPFTALSANLSTIHHLQPFHPDYFIPETEVGQEKLFSYSAENCEAALALTSGQRKTNTFFPTPLPPPPAELKQLTINELVRFFSHPCRYLLLNRVGIAPIEEVPVLETSEPFTLKGLNQYNLGNEILEYLLKNRDCNELYQIAKAKGILPHGSPGETSFAQLIYDLQSFRKKVSVLLTGQESRQLQVCLTIGDYTLTGLLENVRADGMIQYRYAKMKPKDVIRSWINHLVLNCQDDYAAPGNGMHTFYAAKEGIFRYAPPADSVLILEELLDLYWQGLTGPLYFFPRASFAFAQETYKGKKEQDALRKALFEWEGNAFNQIGEKNDTYNLICCKKIDLSDPLFKEQAKKVFLPALEHQEKIA